MKTIRIHSPGHPLTRRAFVGAVSAAGVLAGTGLNRVRAQTSSKLKAAVIGHTGRGDYGHGLERIFAGRPNIELVALADPDPEGRAKTAARIGAPRQYADYREMLAQEHPQLVSLGMRQSDQHYTIGLDVLRAGAHLYCEKPFTTTPAEADELLKEAESRHLKIAVAHVMRMTPAVLRLERAIAEGLIGDLVELRAFGKQDSRAGGEDMMVLGSHLFDLMRLYAGDPLWCTARVLWKGRDITPADGRLVRDNVGLVAGDRIFAQFAFAKGVNGSFTSASPLRETVGHWGIEFYGSKGAARLNCDIAPNAFLGRSNTWSAAGRTLSWEPLTADRLKTPPRPNAGPVGDWLEAIAMNREPECSGRNGGWAVEMALGVYQAALRRERVPFPLTLRTHPLAAR